MGRDQPGCSSWQGYGVRSSDVETVVKALAIPAVVARLFRRGGQIQSGGGLWVAVGRDRPGCLSSQLYSVRPSDVETVEAPAIPAVVAVGAGLLPAARASVAGK